MRACMHAFGCFDIHTMRSVVFVMQFISPKH